MGIITFNGVTSESLGIQVEHPPAFEIPERDYNVISIPGRNGDIVIDNGCYKNVNRKYNIAIGAAGGSFTTFASNVSSWLHSAIGYARLEDSYDPNHYKLAMYTDDNSIENILQQAGRATINFNRKPQRFLKSGDTKITITGSNSITNPTNFISLPLIVVKGTGNGVINIGGYTATLTNVISSTTLNSEIETVYNGSTNLNMYVTLNKGFPKLVPGANTITFSGGITSVEIYPKWWTI
jgi:phage-related protein